MNPSASPGAVQAVVRTLEGCPDPSALYAELSDQGRRPDSILLESVDITTGLAEQSFIIPEAALRAECRGHVVTMTPLGDDGRDACAALTEFLLRRALKVESTPDGGLQVHYAPPPAGASEQARVEAPSPLEALRALAWGWSSLPETPAPLMTAGVFAYDLLECIEPLPGGQRDLTDFPDYVFWLPRALIVLNHQTRSAVAVAFIFGGAHAEASAEAATQSLDRFEAAARAAQRPAEPAAAPAMRSPDVDMSDEAFASLVVELKEHIVAGDVFQIVPSRTFSVPCEDPLATYGRLRALNRSPYMFFVRHPDYTLLGASPETCVKVSREATAECYRVEIRPIAGTARRGRAPDGSVDRDLDGRLEAALRLDEKEVAEHMMLVDLARNDIARVSKPGTRHVPGLLTVDRYSHVMHLVSYVEGELRDDLDAFHAYASSMNMGTLVGAPKIRAAQLLRGYEATRRGPYGGAVGYITSEGEMDTAIVIRSALVHDGVAHVRAGAGVVHDSDPASEALETRRKAQAVLKALGDPGEVG